MKELSVNHLLGIKYINKNDIDLIFETADHFKEVINRPIKKVPSLRDITIANIFFENSTRTKLSFELAQKRLSADVISFSAAQSSVKKGETLIDTVNNILSMKVDLVVMRHSNPGAAHFLANNVKASIINAGDGANEHPTQTLLDLYTIKSKFGRLSNLKVVIGGDPLHSRAMRSLALGLSLYSNNTVYFLSPKKLSLSRDLFAQLKKKGLKVEEIFNEKDMPLDAHIWYWNRIQKERFVSRKEAKKIKESFVVTPSFLKKYGNKKLIIMNPLPRIDEISIEVDSDPRSVYFEQAKNGMYVRMALLALVLKKI